MGLFGAKDKASLSRTPVKRKAPVPSTGKNIGTRVVPGNEPYKVGKRIEQRKDGNLAAAYNAFRRNGATYEEFIKLVHSLLRQYDSPVVEVDPVKAIYLQNDDIVSIAETWVSLIDEFEVNLNPSDEEMMKFSIQDLAKICGIRIG